VYPGKRKRRMIMAIFTSAEVTKNETREFLSSIYSFHRFITRTALHLIVLHMIMLTLLYVINAK